MKIEFKIIVCFLVCSFFTALQVYAQPTYWEKAEKKYQQDYRDRIVTNMNMKPGTVTTPASNGSTPELFKTKEQKAADAAYVAEVRQREAAAYQREQDRIRDHQLYLQRIAYEKAEQKRVFITNTFNAARVNKNYTDLDIKIFAQDEFYKSYSTVKQANPPDYLAAAKYLVACNAKGPDTALDTLINYVWKSRLFSDFSTKKFQELQQRFPAQKERLERLELNIVPYYFGASNPYLSSGLGYTYPLCSFELMNDDQQQAVLNRFEELESAYPETALKVAGYCRNGFNPYFKYATSNLPLKNKTSAKRLAYLYKTMATIQQEYTLTSGKFTEADWRYSADILLRPAANEMKLIYPGFVEELTAEQWQDIATATKLNVKYIAWAFRDNDNDYLKKLPNLTNALKDEFKKQDDGEGTINFENRDKYVGAIKNGKPNGIGKYTSISGDTYEGNFKDGYLHGYGKSYAAKNVGDGANRVIYAGDEYTGDFDNGARHGKGTLINKSRSNYKYIGDWVNGKQDGEGEQSYSGNLNEYYKGSFRKGDYEGFGTFTYGDGSVYTGQFESGRREGKGVLTYKDGSRLEGSWWNNILEGKGILTTAKGYINKYIDEIKKQKSKGKVYSWSVTRKNVKYYSPDGKEITEAEFNANK